MKIVYILITVLILGGGYYLIANTDNQNQSSPETQEYAPPPAPTNPLQVVIPGKSSTNDSVAEVAEEGVNIENSEDEEVLSETEEEATEDTEEISEELVFEVGGVNFSFDVKEIRVKEGDTVTINFTSNDGVHDWVIDEFSVATDQVQADASSSVTFVADTVGTYEYYCSVGNHREQGMVGTLIVE